MRNPGPRPPNRAKQAKGGGVRDEPEHESLPAVRGKNTGWGHLFHEEKEKKNPKSSLDILEETRKRRRSEDSPSG